jgi:hypothetical protein
MAPQHCQQFAERAGKCGDIGQTLIMRSLASFDLMPKLVEAGGCTGRRLRPRLLGTGEEMRL